MIDAHGKVLYPGLVTVTDDEVAYLDGHGGDTDRPGLLAGLQMNPLYYKEFAGDILGVIP